MMEWMQKEKARAEQLRRRFGRPMTREDLGDAQKRARAWQELRNDLAGLLRPAAGHHTLELLALMAPAAPPAAFDWWQQFWQCPLLLEGHALISLVIVKQDERWRPNMPGRFLGWQVQEQVYTDLGAALVEAERVYRDTPEHAERVKRQVAAEQAQPPGAEGDAPWDDASVAAATAPPAELAPEAARPWEAGGVPQLGADLPSKHKK